NISLMWSVIFLALVGGALVIASPGTLHALPWRRLFAIAGLAVAATAVNAWFLFPDLAYSGRTFVSKTAAFSTFGAWFARPSVYLSPLRVLPEEHKAVARQISKDFGRHHPPNSLYVQLPVLVVVWLIGVALLLARRGWKDRVKSVWVAQIVVLAA